MADRLPLGGRGSDPMQHSAPEFDLGGSWSGSGEKKSLSLSHTHSQMKQLLPVGPQIRRSTEPLSFLRSTPENNREKDREKERDKARTSVTKGMQRQLILEHEERNLAEAAMHKDLQRRVEDTRDRVARVEAQLQETIARMESRLRARDEDLAELREELRTSRPTIPAWGPEVAVGAAGVGVGAPEEAGPGLGALAAELAEVRRSMAAEISEQVRRHEEASAGVAARITVLEQHLQEGLEQLRETQGEQLSEGIILRRRVGRMEAELREVVDAAGKEAQSLERRMNDAAQAGEASPASADSSRCFASPGSASSRRSRTANLLEALEAVQESPEAETEEDFTAESDAALRAPRLSIMKGSDFDPSPGHSSTGSPVFRRSQTDNFQGARAHREDRPVVRRSSSDLAEVMRCRRERCQEWESPDRPLPQAIATSPALVAAPSSPSSAAEAGSSEEQHTQGGGAEGTPAVFNVFSDRPSVDCSPTAASGAAVAIAESVDCGEEPADVASPLASRIESLEGRLEAGDRRLEDLQSGLSIEIAAVRDLVEALPTPGEQDTQLSEAELRRVAAESEALDARLAALERRAESSEGTPSRDQEPLRNRVSCFSPVGSLMRQSSLLRQLSFGSSPGGGAPRDAPTEEQRSQIAELRDRVESLASEVAKRQAEEREQPSVAEEAQALGELVRALETRLQDGLSELREGQEAEIALLRSRMEAVEGEQNARPPEQCPEATSPERARGLAAAPGGAAQQPAEADSLDDEIEELGRRLEGSDTRIEELMRKMMAESEEERSESAEQQAAALEATGAKGGPQAAQPPTVAALQLPPAGSHADERPSGSETRRALEALRGRLQAEAEGLRERLEVHAERCDRQIRGVHEERAAGESQLLERLEEAAAAGGRGEELAQAMMREHSEEVERSAAQRALLEGEQRRLAAEATTLWQRLEALEAAESRERQALAAEAADGFDVAIGRQAFASAFGRAAAGTEAEAEAEAEAPPVPPGPADEALPQEDGREDSELEALHDRIEALAGEQGQQLARVEEHQEVLECLQGQVGVLETCLEDNDGKLTEIQTTLLQARLEGLVAMDERVKSLEGELQASSMKLSEGQLQELAAHSSALSERLSALEQSFEDVRQRARESSAREVGPSYRVGRVFTSPETGGNMQGRPRPRMLNLPSLSSPAKDSDASLPGQVRRAATNETLPMDHAPSMGGDWTPSVNDPQVQPADPAEPARPTAPEVRAPDREQPPLVAERQSMTSSEDTSSSSQSVCDDLLQELRRYVDERLRKLQSAQQDTSADTAELRRRVDEVAQGVPLVGHHPLPAKLAEEAADGGEGPAVSSVDERLQALEGKCGTMLNLLLRL